MSKHNGTYHAQLQATRRTLESELAGIDGNIRDAINNGDAAQLGCLMVRKTELPKLFIAASMAETNCRREGLNVEDQANTRRLREAQDARDNAQAACTKLQREYETEMAALTAQLQETETRVGAALATIEASHSQAAGNDLAYQRALTKVTPYFL